MNDVKVSMYDCMDVTFTNIWIYKCTTCTTVWLYHCIRQVNSMKRDMTGKMG